MRVGAHFRMIAAPTKVIVTRSGTVVRGGVELWVHDKLFVDPDRIFVLHSSVDALIVRLRVRQLAVLAVVAHVRPRFPASRC